MRALSEFAFVVKTNSSPLDMHPDAVCSGRCEAAKLMIKCDDEDKCK